MQESRANVYEMRGVAVPSGPLRDWVRRALHLLALLTAACGPEAAPWDPYVPPASRGDAMNAPPDAAPNRPSQPEVWPEPGVTTPTGVPVQPPAGVPVGAVPPAGMPSAGGSPAGAVAPQPGAAGAGAPPAAIEPPSAFRITELFLRDPHFFVAGTDVTDTTVAGMSINRTIIPSQLTMDSDRDGMFDVSTLLIVQPFDPRVAMGTLRIVDGACPIAGGACRRSDVAISASWTISNLQQGMCLTPLAGTLGNTAASITLPTPPCFVTTAGQNLNLSLAGTELAVSTVTVSATYQASPKQLLNGLLTGFVTTAAAMRAILPREVGPPAAGMPIGNFVRSADKDDARSPTGEPGFFIYFNFVAKPVEFVE